MRRNRAQIYDIATARWGIPPGCCYIYICSYLFVMRNYDCRGKLLSPPVPVLVAGSTLIDCLGRTFDTELFERVGIDRGKDC